MSQVLSTSQKSGAQIRLDGDLVDGRPEHAGELLPECLVLADPVVVPRAPALLRPFRQVPLNALAATSVERRERAVVQVVEALGDRELRAPGFLVHGQSRASPGDALKAGGVAPPGKAV